MKHSQMKSDWGIGIVPGSGLPEQDKGCKAAR